MNCFGRDKIAAMENVHTPIPQVENTAVVTMFRQPIISSDVVEVLTMS